MRLHDDPTLGEAVAAIISLIAIALIGWLAVDGNAAAQTALVSLTGAAAGTYFMPRSNGNGNGTSKPPAPKP
jgi:hypothetical protein